MGCGIIAIYNMSLLLGDPIDIRSVIYWFEQNKGFVLNGIFGVNPNVIQTFYDNLNIPATGFSDIASLVLRLWKILVQEQLEIILSASGMMQI